MAMAELSATSAPVEASMQAQQQQPLQAQHQAAASANRILFLVVVSGADLDCLEDPKPTGPRYTRDSLRNLLQLLGCKPRLAYKVMLAVFQAVDQAVTTARQQRISRKTFQVHPHRNGKVYVSLTRADFMSLVSTCAAQYSYKISPSSEELKVACSLRERRRCVVVLLCGTSGSGKSTLASILASRLGITTVVSTDSIRHMLRSFISRESSPLLWASTYQAGECLGPSSNTQEASSECERALCGYKAQCQLLAEHLEQLVAGCEARMQSLICEGVHLNISAVAKLMSRHPSVLPFLVYIPSESKHVERMAVRAKYMTLDPNKNRYVRYMGNIRLIQEYLVRKADKYCVPRVDNSNVDRSVGIIHLTVMGCLRRMARGEPALDPATGRTSMLAAEYAAVLDHLQGEKDRLEAATAAAADAGSSSSTSKQAAVGCSSNSLVQGGEAGCSISSAAAAASAGPDCSTTTEAADVALKVRLQHAGVLCGQHASKGIPPTHAQNGGAASELPSSAQLAEKAHCSSSSCNGLEEVAVYDGSCGRICNWSTAGPSAAAGTAVRHGTEAHGSAAPVAAGDSAADSQLDEQGSQGIGGSCGGSGTHVGGFPCSQQQQQQQQQQQPLSATPEHTLPSSGQANSSSSRVRSGAAGGIAYNTPPAAECATAAATAAAAAGSMLTMAPGPTYSKAWPQQQQQEQDIAGSSSAGAGQVQQGGALPKQQASHQQLDSATPSSSTSTKLPQAAVAAAAAETCSSPALRQQPGLNSGSSSGRPGIHKSGVSSSPHGSVATATGRGVELSTGADGQATAVELGRGAGGGGVSFSSSQLGSEDEQQGLNVQQQQHWLSKKQQQQDDDHEDLVSSGEELDGLGELGSSDNEGERFLQEYGSMCESTTCDEHDDFDDHDGAGGLRAWNGGMARALWPSYSHVYAPTLATNNASSNGAAATHRRDVYATAAGAGGSGGSGSGSVRGGHQAAPISNAAAAGLLRMPPGVAAVGLPTVYEAPRQEGVSGRPPLPAYPASGSPTANLPAAASAGLGCALGSSSRAAALAARAGRGRHVRRSGSGSGTGNGSLQYGVRHRAGGSSSGNMARQWSGGLGLQSSPEAQPAVAAEPSSEAQPGCGRQLVSTAAASHG